MEQPVRVPEWHCFGGSVQGDGHKKIGLPNEDAVQIYQERDACLPVIISVADGLGGKEFFRAERGSREAVKNAVEAGKTFISSLKTREVIDEASVRSGFCRVFVDEWVSSVMNDFGTDPPSFEDQEKNEKNAKFYFPSTGEQETGDVREKFFASFPYSTTSITLIVTDSQIIIAQIGNGDVVMIEADGTTSRPFPEAGPDVGVETLAMPGSSGLFRICVRTITPGTSPVAAFVSTDGYSNSYISDFERYIAEIWTDFFKSYDLDTINEGIVPFLNRLSAEGSGDDITLGILCNIPVIKNISLTLPVAFEERLSLEELDWGDGAVTIPCEDASPTTLGERGIPDSGNPEEETGSGGPDPDRELPSEVPGQGDAGTGEYPEDQVTARDFPAGSSCEEQVSIASSRDPQAVGEYSSGFINKKRGWKRK